MKRPGSRTLLRVLLVLGASVLGLEGLFRLVLFHPEWAPEGTGLRRPELYFAGDDPRFWVLRARLNGHHELGEPDDPDPVLGWTSGRFEPGTRLHMDEALLGDQRPVLLVGDSFAACSGAPDRCYEHLLEEGPLGPTHELLNYGVGGYGTDQALLLSFDLMERFAERDPIVVLSILVDDDLDRCTLPYRGAPKPVLEADGERRVRIARPAAPLDRAAWFAANPLEVPWWSWRFLQVNLLMDEEALVADSGVEGRLETMRVAMAAGLLEWKDRLDALGLEGFVLLFGDRQRHEGVSTKEDRFRWLEAVLEGQGIPWIRAWEELEQDWELYDRSLDEYFVTGKVGKGHYTALGNELTHLALERGLRGAFDGPSLVLHDSDRQDRIGPGAFVRWERYPYASFGEDDLPHALLRPGDGEGGSAELAFVPERAIRRFEATLRPMPDFEGAAELVLTTTEGVAHRSIVRGGDPDRRLVVDLPEVGRLDFTVRSVEGEASLPFLMVHPALDGHPHGPMLVTQ
jgi:hypothetical protein